MSHFPACTSVEFMAIELLEATAHTYRVYDISQFGDSRYPEYLKIP
jgi:hypothetical protein